MQVALTLVLMFVMVLAIYITSADASSTNVSADVCDGASYIY